MRDIEVTSVSAAEQPPWGELMQEHHYLGFQGMIGESLRFVAVDRSGGWGFGDYPVQLRSAVFEIGESEGPHPQAPTTPSVGQ